MSDWLRLVPPRSWDFTEWITEDPAIEARAGVPYAGNQEMLDRFGLTQAMIASLLAQPWIRYDAELYRLLALNQDAFWAWCTEIGYLTEAQVGLLRARMALKLMEDS